MSGIAVDCVLDARAGIGEGAIWSVEDQALWWVDIPAGRLCRFDPETHENRVWEVGQPVGCFAFKKSGGFVLAMRDGFFDFDPDSGAMEAIGDPEADKPENRFNDGTVDYQGRFYAGTMPMAGADAQRGPEGALYRLDPDGSIHTVMGGIFVTNGLALAPDGRTIYLADTFPAVRAIWAYDYDPNDAVWSNRRVFFDSRAVDGRPDGGTVDADGCYWMAGVGGWELVRLTPAGAIDRRIPMPVERPTRIAFGGRNLDTLYVTSIGGKISPGTEDRQPHAGGVFALRVPGVVGLPFPKFGA